MLPYARSVNTVEALQLALELADTADAITMDRFRAHDLVVTTKPDLTPVSEADQAVERAIRARLADTTHGCSARSTAPTTTPPVPEYRWIIDPIDGTKSYVRGVPIWATLIGLERAGEMIVGVASAPALGMRWWAGKGLGAFRDGERLGVSAVARARRRADLVRLGHGGALPRGRHRNQARRPLAPVLADARHRRLLAAPARRRRRVRRRDRPDRRRSGTSPR